MDIKVIDKNPEINPCVLCDDVLRDLKRDLKGLKEDAPAVLVDKIERAIQDNQDNNIS